VYVHRDGGTLIPQRNRSIKSITQVQLLLTSLSNSSTVKSEVGTPILKVHMLKRLCKTTILEILILDQVDDFKGKKVFQL